MHSSTLDIKALPFRHLCVFLFPQKFYILVLLPTYHPPISPHDQTILTLLIYRFTLLYQIGSLLAPKFLSKASRIFLEFPKWERGPNNLAVHPNLCLKRDSTNSKLPPLPNEFCDSLPSSNTVTPK